MSEVLDSTEKDLLGEGQEEELSHAPQVDEEEIDEVSVTSVPDPEPVPSTSKEPASKEETEPKEVIVLDHSKAEALLAASMKERGFTNSRLPALIGKLEADIAERQFGEEFPKLSDVLVRRARDEGKTCSIDFIANDIRNDDENEQNIVALTILYFSYVAENFTETTYIAWILAKDKKPFTVEEQLNEAGLSQRGEEEDVEEEKEEKEEEKVLTLEEHRSEEDSKAERSDKKLSKKKRRKRRHSKEENSNGEVSKEERSNGEVSKEERRKVNCHSFRLLILGGYLKLAIIDKFLIEDVDLVLGNDVALTDKTFPIVLNSSNEISVVTRSKASSVDSAESVVDVDLSSLDRSDSLVVDSGVLDNKLN
ncbi:transcriptional regulator ATRX homolog [Palaemon carinicauda]|uniref:transcriptional regulator ATRX homolog n=1 Tax=Palaemon carinicauda TaxID=392227 RepID=UPI0035B5F396